MAKKKIKQKKRRKREGVKRPESHSNFEARNKVAEERQIGGDAKPNLLWREVKTWFVVVIGWLGLSGLADGIVEWSNWFESGVLQHWEILTTYLIDFSFGFLNRTAIDLMAFYAVFLRAIFASIDMPWKAKLKQLGVVFYSPILMVGVFAAGASSAELPNLWGLLVSLWTMSLLPIIFEHSPNFDGLEKKTYFRIVLSSVILFFLTLFIASDVLYTLGGAKRPT